MRVQHWEGGHTRVLHHLRDHHVGRAGKLQLSQVHLDRDLLGARGRKEEIGVAVLKDGATTDRKTVRIREHPEPNLCVEQNPHVSRSSNSRRTESGSDWSKSPVHRIFPAYSPNGRTPPTRSIGTSRATGRPARAITISSPPATRRRSLEKWVFASWMFTVIARQDRLSLSNPNRIAIREGEFARRAVT